MYSTHNCRKMSEEGEILAYLKLAKVVTGCTVSLAILAWKFWAFKRVSRPGQQPQKKKRLIVPTLKAIVQLVAVGYNIHQVLS